MGKIKVGMGNNASAEQVTTKSKASAEHVTLTHTIMEYSVFVIMDILAMERRNVISVMKHVVNALDLGQKIVLLALMSVMISSMVSVKEILLVLLVFI